MLPEFKMYQPIHFIKVVVEPKQQNLISAKKFVKRTGCLQPSNSLLEGDDLNSHPLVIEDCTVVYARAYWHHWSGGNIFNMRGKGGGSGGYTITFKNIVVEDPRPTLQPFKILMEGRYYISFHAVKRLPRHYLNDLKAELSQVQVFYLALHFY